LVRAIGRKWCDVPLRTCANPRRRQIDLYAQTFLNANLFRPELIALATIADKLRWRLKRALAFPPKLIGRLFATSYYDLVLSRHRRTHQGAVAWQPRAVIFLIFPRTGLLRSHLTTLRYFVHKGFAPVVVANLPLSEDDRHAVIPHCHKLIERPNFGYDFGGYRDGVLSLIGDFDRLEFIALLNDSCWFPLPGSSDWVDDALALNVDFAGAASNYGIARQRPGHYDFTRWTYSPDNAGFHYCSFALLISQTLFRDRAFQRFWTGFNLSNDKREVIQRGEVGLSQWVISNGFSHASTLDIAHFDADLELFSLERIREIAQDLIIPEERELREAKTELLDRFDGSEAWRKEAILFILLAVAQTGASYALPEFAVRDKSYQFLKKSPLWLDRDSAESTLRIARRLEGDDAVVILEEAILLRSGSDAKASRILSDQ
jgi:hypothetical protein